jgi:GNAT superfamily N-acetyltransferase
VKTTDRNPKCGTLSTNDIPLPFAYPDSIMPTTPSPTPSSKDFYLTVKPQVPQWRLQMTEIFQLAFHDQCVFRWFHKTMLPKPTTAADLDRERTNWWKRILALYAANPHITQVFAISKDKVIGVAQWQVPGQARAESFLQWFYRQFLILSLRVHVKFFAPEWLNIDHWEMRGHGRRGKDTWEDALGDDYHQYHILDILWVTPEWQRRGIGVALIRWGLERAEGMGMGAVLATDLGEMTDYYAKFGFVVFKQWRYGDEDGFVQRNLMRWKP